MRISQLIKDLEHVLKFEGDLEVTCTHALCEKGEEPFPNYVETTVENLIVALPNEDFDEKRVRVWL